MNAQPDLFLSPPDTLLPDGARLRQTATPAGLIDFVLVRSRRRSIGFVITGAGLRVSAPGWVSLKQIDEAVVEKSAWIKKKMDFWRDRQQIAHQEKITWSVGDRIPLLGKKIMLALDPTARHPRYQGNAQAPAEGDVLWLPLPSDADGPIVRQACVTWLQGLAQATLDRRLRLLAQQAGLQFKQWKLSNARARWGSCTSDGVIRLNWRLVHFAPDVIDYVIAHELAHLKEMNHSDRFWAQVGIILPGYEPAMQLLKQADMSALPTTDA